MEIDTSEMDEFLGSMELLDSWTGCRLVFAFLVILTSFVFLVFFFDFLEHF